MNTWVNIFMSAVSDSRYVRALQTTKLCKILDSLHVKSGYSKNKYWSYPSWGKTLQTMEWAPCWVWRSSVIHWASQFLYFSSPRQSIHLKCNFAQVKDERAFGSPHHPMSALPLLCKPLTSELCSGIWAILIADSTTTASRGILCAWRVT